MIFGQIRGARNRREQRGRSNLEGAPAPPVPWRPRTRGGTLLPSRGSPRKKKEGGSLPLAFGGAGVPSGATIGIAIYINNLATVNTNFLPLYAEV